MVKVADLPSFDAADYLDSEEAIAAYLNAIMEENDDALLASALGDIAKARAISILWRCPPLIFPPASVTMESYPFALAAIVS